MKKLGFWAPIAVFVAGIILVIVAGMIDEAVGVNDMDMIGAFVILAGLTCLFFYLSRDRFAGTEGFLKALPRRIFGLLAIIFAIGTGLFNFFFMISSSAPTTTGVFDYALRLCWMFTGACCWVVYKLAKKNDWDWAYPLATVLAVVGSFVVGVIISAFRSLTFSIFGAYTLADFVAVAILIALVVGSIKLKADGDLSELERGIREKFASAFAKNERDAEDKEVWNVPNVNVHAGKVVITGGSRVVSLKRSQYTEDEFEDKQAKLRWEEAEVMPQYLERIAKDVMEYINVTGLSVSVSGWKVIINEE